MGVGALFLSLPLFLSFARCCGVETVEDLMYGLQTGMTGEGYKERARAREGEREKEREVRVCGEGGRGKGGARRAACVPSHEQSTGLRLIANVLQLLKLFLCHSYLE